MSGRNNNNPMGLIGVIVAVIVAPLAAMMVQFAISRTREYAADRAGAEITGNPRGLASALVNISNAAHRIPNMDAERRPATAHMFIINPLTGQRMDNLFSTHPSTENRVAALLEMEQGGMVRPAAAGPVAAEPPSLGRGARRGPWG